MPKTELIEALKRSGLSEDDAKRSASVVDKVLENQQCQQVEALSAPLGNLFKDAIVEERTGFLTGPTKAKRFRLHKRGHPNVAG